MLACESTTPRCNPHLEDKPTIGKRVTATINGRFLELWSSGNLAEHRLEPIFDDGKPRDKRSVHRDSQE